MARTSRRLGALRTPKPWDQQPGEGAVHTGNVQGYREGRGSPSL